MSSTASENIELRNNYLEVLTPYRDKAKRSQSFVRGAQYSRKEKTLLKQAGLIPIVINVARPLLGQRRAIITSSRPTWKVVPLQGANKVVADASQQYLVGKWNADYVDVQYARAVWDSLVTGVGYLFVDKASFLDNATFDIVIRHVGWEYVLPDPYATEFDLSDAENILIRKLVSPKRAQILYQLDDEQIKEAVIENPSTDPATIDQVEVLDRFSKFPVVCYDVRPKKDQHLRDLPTVFYTDTLVGKTNEENRKMAIEMTKLSNEGKIDLTRMRDLHIHRAISVGHHSAYTGMMDIRDYPIVPFINEMGTTFKDCQGDVEHIEGMQKGINKFYLLTMHNAMMTGNSRVMAPKGAIKNKTVFQRTSTLPGAVVEWEPDPTLPNGGKPEPIQGGSLSTAFFGLSNDLIEKAKFETSVYSPMLGDKQGTPETFSTTASLQDFGTQSIKELARRFDICVARVGEVVIQFIQNYTSRNELLEFVDVDNGQLRSPMVPKDAVNPGNEASGPDEQQQMVAVKLNEVIIKEGIVSEIKNNARLGKYAVKVLTQPNLGTDRLIKAAFMQNMIMNKAIPATPAVMQMLMDYMEFPSSGKLIEQMKAEQSASAKVAQLEEQLKRAGEMMKMAEDENMKLQQRAKLQDLDTEIQVMKAELKSASEKVLSEMQAQLESVLGKAATSSQPSTTGE